LNWLIQVQGDTVVVIPGASSVSQAEQAAGVMDFKLSDAEVHQLEELTRNYR
jgi:diketogulonate reductase-like aldo/keto reductase